MFPDGEIASQMELDRLKLSFIVNFGLAPYFREILKNETVASECHSISFDESINKVVQECEMGIIVGLWDNLSSKEQIRIYSSMFFGDSSSTDHLKHFTDGFSGLITQRIFKSQWMTQTFIRSF